MIVYHASETVIEKPDIIHSRPFLDLFFAGDISEKEALSRLKYEKPNHQLCFRNQKAIDELLVFIGAEEQV